MAEDASQELRFDIQAHFRVLWKRKWLILAFTVVLTTVVGFGTSFQPRVYEARATLLVGRDSPRLLTSDPVPGERLGQRDYLKTQAAILTSRTLLQGAVKRLMKDGVYGPIDPAAVEERSAHLAGDLQHAIRVLTTEDTSVITLVVSGGAPIRVSKIADAIAEEYVSSSEDARVSMANDAARWLQTKLADQRTKLADAEEELRTYKEKEKIVAPDDADPFSTLALSRLNDDYLTARFQRIEKQTRLAAMRKSRQGASSQGKGSAALAIDADVDRKVKESLEAEYVQAQVDLRNLSQRYGPEYPDIITLKEKIARLAHELESFQAPPDKPEPVARATESQIADLQAEVTALTQKEAALSQALEAHKVQARTLSRTAVGYSLRKQAVDLNRQTYNDLLSRLNDAQLSAQIRTSPVKVLDRAEVPRSPIAPRPVRNVALAVALGLVLGVALAMLSETLDRRIRNPQEAVRYLRLPLLTVIPAPQPGRRKPTTQDAGTRLVTVEDPRSHASECYRNLRTSILFSSGPPIPRTILVTSAVSGEGKSTTAANLAVVMSQSGRKVLLIDADLRRPSLHRYFKDVRKGGIVPLLKDGIRPSEAVRRSPVENLDLLLCHEVPANPSELLGSARFLEALEHFKGHYEVVVIDSPVVVSVPDTLILASRAEAVVMVHKPGAATRDMVRYARERLDEVKSNILGLVLNHVNLDEDPYAYSNHRYYGYGTEETEKNARGGAGKTA